MKQDAGARIAADVLAFFKARGGFDNWWGTIDRECQEEILDDLQARVTSELSGYRRIQRAAEQVAHSPSTRVALERMCHLSDVLEEEP